MLFIIPSENHNIGKCPFSHAMTCPNGHFSALWSVIYIYIYYYHIFKTLFAVITESLHVR